MTEKETFPVGVKKSIHRVSKYKGFGKVHALSHYPRGPVPLCGIFKGPYKITDSEGTLDQVTCGLCQRTLKHGRRPVVEAEPKGDNKPQPPMAKVEESPAAQILAKLKALEGRLDQLETDMKSVARGFRAELTDATSDLHVKMNVMQDEVEALHLAVEEKAPGVFRRLFAGSNT